MEEELGGGRGEEEIGGGRGEEEIGGGRGEELGEGSICSGKPLSCSCHSVCVQWQRYWGGRGGGRSPPHFVRRGGNAPPLFLRTEQFNPKLELFLAIHQRMEVAFNYRAFIVVPIICHPLISHDQFPT